MSIPHDDLVAFALGALEEGDLARIEEAVARDDDDAAELEQVRTHLDLHGSVPEIHPEPALWQRISVRIDEPVQPRSLLRRFWMPAAAAALILLALFLPRGREPGGIVRLHGELERGLDRTWTARGVSRLRIGGGVTVTLDTGTVITTMSDNRLALGAGRVFLEVSRARRGFAVVTDDIVVETTGTRFLVERTPGSPEGTLVFVEKGSVQCFLPARTIALRAGQHYGRESLPEGYARDWFRRPTLTARILDAHTMRVVLRNEMPDAIELAPPIGGEPLFFADKYPLPARGFTTPVTLRPYQERTFDLDVPGQLRDREAFFVVCPKYRVRTEASR